MAERGSILEAGGVATFILTHRHAAAECGAAFAAWRGFDSPLRHGAALGSCANSSEDNHTLVWTVEADDGEGALAQLPPYVAERTTATQVKEVSIP